MKSVGAGGAHGVHRGFWRTSKSGQNMSAKFDQSGAKGPQGILADINLGKICQHNSISQVLIWVLIFEFMGGPPIKFQKKKIIGF